MLIKLETGRKVFLPNDTHPDIVKFILKHYDTNGRFRFHYLYPDVPTTWSNGVTTVDEGYLSYRTYGFIQIVCTKNAWRSYYIPWELITRIEYSNKRKGGVLFEVSVEEVQRRFF